MLHHKFLPPVLAIILVSMIVVSPATAGDSVSGAGDLLKKVKFDYGYNGKNVMEHMPNRPEMRYDGPFHLRQPGVVG